MNGAPNATKDGCVPLMFVIQNTVSPNGQTAKALFTCGDWPWRQLCEHHQADASANFGFIAGTRSNIGSLHK